ncbi:MAG: hypothetical protein QNJ12_11075 [Ilumatobacter sp.]|uniref:hypothetical protein n=1 Tax=Ilumatobacter sp. TaxID=1967498 RepID=UPI002619ADF2|nr:hypothetical protein [Ilumatobacter sp.]MDJ0769331.1 hypothetical protein [Ilumatobacter sp.]
MNDVPTDLGDRLVVAGWLFGLASAFHVADHLRRGQGSITETLYVLGNAALVLQVVTVVLVVVRHQLGPLFAAIAGPSLAVGFAAAHWLPEWSAMSDPIWEVDTLRWMSVAASGSEIVAAAAIGVLGTLVLRSRGLESVVAPR